MVETPTLSTVVNKTPRHAHRNTACLSTQSRDCETPQMAN